MIAFGQDGKLYISLGDGDVMAVRPVMRRTAHRYWKILRLDVDGAAPYVVPPDNPYVGRPGWRGEIWQLGFRNPWRWSFDRANGDLYIGDVRRGLWEEVDHVPAPVVGGTTSAGRSRRGRTVSSRVPIVSPSAWWNRCSSIRTDSPAGDGAGMCIGPGLPLSSQGTYFYGDFLLRGSAASAGWRVSPGVAA